MTVDPITLLAIVAMGLATYVTRLAGMLMATHLELVGRTKAVVEAIPGCTLISVIAPLVFLNGPADMVAGAITALAAWRLPMVAVLSIGVVAASLLRAIIG